MPVLLWSVLPVVAANKAPPAQQLTAATRSGRRPEVESPAAEVRVSGRPLTCSLGLWRNPGPVVVGPRSCSPAGLQPTGCPLPTFPALRPLCLQSPQRHVECSSHFCPSDSATSCRCTLPLGARGPLRPPSWPPREAPVSVHGLCDWGPFLQVFSVHIPGLNCLLVFPECFVLR